MGGRGPAPKPAGQRRRRNLPVGARTLPADVTIEAPALNKRPDGLPWHPAALEYWKAIWSSPMAAELVDADVHGLVMLVDLVHLYWSVDPLARGGRRAKMELAAEIRLQRQNYGLTPLDRSRLKWEIEKAAGAEEAGQRRRASHTGGEDPRSQW